MDCTTELKGSRPTYLSASTILVLVTFSMVNFVFPFFPATLPIALDKWSPLSGFTGTDVYGHMNTQCTVLVHQVRLKATKSNQSG